MSSVIMLYGKFRVLIHETARFGVVGLAGVVVTDGGANLLQYGAGLDRFTATAVATIIATGISFVASRYWTFRHRRRSGARRETVLFFTVNGMGVAISEGCVGLALALGLTGKLSYNVALNGGIALATLFRYWSYRTWIWPTATPAANWTGRWPVRRMAHEWLRRLSIRELAKFGVVGTFAFAVMVGGSFLLHVRAGAGLFASSFAGTVVAMLVSYAGNRCWTFRHRQRPGLRRECIRYAALYGAGLAIQHACQAFAVFGLGQRGHSSYLAALFIGAGLAAVAKFCSYREWVWPSPALPGPRIFSKAIS